jgi:membrane protein
MGIERNTVVETESRQVQAQRRYGVWHQFRTIYRLSPRRVGSLLWQAYGDWSADGAARLGAALAYYTLFSVAPVLIVITGVAGLFVGQAAARGEIGPWLTRFLSPEGARAAELMLAEHATPAGGVLTTLIGLISLFLATSALVSELRQSLNLLWKVQGPPTENLTVLGALGAMLSDRVYAFLIVVGAGVLITASLVVNTTVAVAGAHFQGWLPLPEWLLHTMNFVMSFTLMTIVFMLVYKTVPDAHVAWGDASIGAVVTAFLFNAGTMLLSSFVGGASASPYGSVASVLALLLWVYYSAQVFYYGAALTRIVAIAHGGQIVPQHRSLHGVWRRHSSATRTKAPTDES